MNAKYLCWLQLVNEAMGNSSKKRRTLRPVCATFVASQWEFVHVILYFDTFFIRNYKYDWLETGGKMYTTVATTAHKIGKKSNNITKLDGMAWCEDAECQSLSDRINGKKRNRDNALISSFLECAAVYFTC